jgi:hypothetical protein
VFVEKKKIEIMLSLNFFSKMHAGMASAAAVSMYNLMD